MKPDTDIAEYIMIWNLGLLERLKSFTVQRGNKFQKWSEKGSGDRSLNLAFFWKEDVSLEF